METPDRTVEEVDGYYVVTVGKDVVAYVSEHTEHPGLWVLEDVAGQVMGRIESWEKAAAFLATWFVAGEPGWI